MKVFVSILFAVAKLAPVILVIASLVIAVGAHSLLSFLEVNYAECFIFHLGFGDGRLRCSRDYRAWRPAGVSH